MDLRCARVRGGALTERSPEKRMMSFQPRQPNPLLILHTKHTHTHRAQRRPCNSALIATADDFAPAAAVTRSVWFSPPTNGAGANRRIKEC